MTIELMTTLVEHAGGNYRVLMNLATDLLAAAAEREITMSPPATEGPTFADFTGYQGPTRWRERRCSPGPGCVRANRAARLSSRDEAA
jgi:hypothetical protein